MLSFLVFPLLIPPAGVHPVHLVVLHLLGSEHGLVVHDAAGREEIFRFGPKYYFYSNTAVSVFVLWFS